jgi:hypothetical protein
VPSERRAGVLTKAGNGLRLRRSGNRGKRAARRQQGETQPHMPDFDEVHVRDKA